MHVADMVPPCETLYDVGCDHGYLGIYLLQQKRCERVVFTDIHKEPLESAKNNVSLAGLSKACDFVCTDGLRGLSPKETDCVCICGMGGPVMESILRAAAPMAYLILEPQSDVIAFHRYLSEAGFVWEKEDMIKESGSKYYPIEAGRFADGDIEKLNVPYPLLKTADHAVYKEFIEYRKKIINEILNGKKKLPQKREAELLDELDSITK